MNYVCVLDSRGRVSVPLDIRRHMRLSAGDRIEFVVEKDQVIFRPMRKKPMRRKINKK